MDASGEVTVSPRLREVVARRLERLEPLGERLLAALAVIDDGFTDAELAALAGAERVDEALGEAEAAGVLECARGRYRFRHALVREELAARLPEEALRRTHADAAALLAADDAPPERVAHHLLRAGRARDAVPLLTQAAEWAAGVGAYRDGAEWAELALEHADERRAPGPACAARAAAPRGRRGPRARPPMPRRSRSRPRSACRRCGRSRRARALRRATSRAPRLRSKGCEAERPEDLGESDPAAWHGGVAYGRLGGRAPSWPPRRTASLPIPATSPT